MAGFFDFNLITDPPGDELVDEQSQLNANLDKMDSRLNQFQQQPDNTVVSPPVGTEALIGNIIRVWTGSAWRFADNPNSGWGSWATIALVAPYVHRTGFTLQYRVNTMIRKVELAGGLYAAAAQTAWPRSKVQVTANTGGIPDTYKPVNNHPQTGAAGIGTTAGQFAGARIWVESNAGNSIKLSVSYQGDDIGGNFVMLDPVRWWY